MYAMYAEQEEEALIEKRKREKKESEQKCRKALQLKHELELAQKREEERKDELLHRSILERRQQRALEEEARKLEEEQKNARIGKTYFVIRNNNADSLESFSLLIKIQEMAQVK